MVRKQRYNKISVIRWMENIVVINFKAFTKKCGLRAVALYALLNTYIKAWCSLFSIVFIMNASL